MGRKLHRKVQTRPRPHLPIRFECPRCEAEAVKIEMSENPPIATIVCGSCHITRTITELKKMWDKVDVYGFWLDRYYEEQEAGISPIEEQIIGEPIIEALNSSDSSRETSIQTQTQIGSINAEMEVLTKPHIEPLTEIGYKEPEIANNNTGQSLSESSSSGFQIPKARSEVLAAKKQEQAKKQEERIQKPKLLRLDDYSKDYKNHSLKEEEKENEKEKEEDTEDN